MKKNILALALLSFSTYASAASTDVTTIKLLGINDFHGQIVDGRKSGSHPVGGAAVMASYFKKEMDDNTVIALMGDQVGASTPASSLLNDEPTILFFNSLGNSHCTPQTRLDPACNIVATVGNHEFDKGQKNLFEMINGRDTAPTNNWIPLPHYPGASFPYISANIVDATTGKPLFQPYIIKNVNGTRIAFIGAILKDAPSVIMPTRIQGIKFLDEADTINQYLPKIKAQGVNIVVVIIHQGGQQNAYEGPTRDNSNITGDIVNIVNRLDDGVDVVMAGHTHQFLNGFLNNKSGNKVLVTQAYSYSAAFAEVTLHVDNKTHSVMDESASIINTYADQAPGNAPDADTVKLIQYAKDKTDPMVNQHIGDLQNPLSKNPNAAGESELGDLITDAMRANVHADISFMNAGGIRANLDAGNVTWGTLAAVQPFSNQVVELALTGDDIRTLLEQQWTTARSSVLGVSGLAYSYDSSKPIGQRVLTITHDGQPLDSKKTYMVATNDFLALGGDGFTVLESASVIKSGDTDLNALISYIESLPQPFSAKIEGRIQQSAG